MFRFTLRDMLWLVALIGAGLAWWMEQQKVIAVTQERDEAVALWHDASKKWVEATTRIPPAPGASGGIGGAGAPVAAGADWGEYSRRSKCRLPAAQTPDS